MKITIFGAAGRVGSRLAYLALDAGHEVNVFIRDRSQLSLTSEKLDVYSGDLQNEECVLRACTGAEVIFSALGGTLNEAPVHSRRRIDALINVSRKLFINRIVAIGGLAILQDSDETMVKDSSDYPTAYKNIALVHIETYEALSGSGLSWTLVCPPTIIEKELTKSFRIQKDFVLLNSSNIGTNDLAYFMLKEAGDEKFSRSRVAIAY